MIWKIARPHFWILDRQIRRLPRFAIPALILLLGMGGQWLYTHFLQPRLALLTSDQSIAAIASFMPSLLMLFLFSAVLGLGDMLYQLYLSQDLELLMTAPVPNWSIFVVKLISCSRATILPAIAAGGLLVILGIARKAGLDYYLLIGPLLLFTMTLVTAVAMSIIILASRFIPAEQARAWLPVALALLSLLSLPLQQPTLAWLIKQETILVYLQQSLVNQRHLTAITISIGALSGIASLTTFRIFDLAFYNGWNRYRIVHYRRPARSRPVLTRCLKPLPSTLRAFLVKEWVILWRTPQALLSLAQPFMMVTIIATFGVAGGTTFRPLLYWILIVFLGFYLIMTGNISQLALSLEGRKIAFLRSAPINAKEIMQGKYWAVWSQSILAWSLAIVIICTLFRLPLGRCALLLIISTWGLTGTLLVSLTLGALYIDFSLQDLRRRLPGPAYWLTVSMNLIFIVLTILSAHWLLVHTAPNAELALQLDALSGFGIVRSILSTSATLPLLLTGGQLLFWSITRLLWAAAIRRLERYQEV